MKFLTNGTRKDQGVPYFLIIDERFTGNKRHRDDRNYKHRDSDRDHRDNPRNNNRDGDRNRNNRKY